VNPYLGEYMKDNYITEYQKQYENYEFEKNLVSIRRNNILNSLNKYPHKRILEIGCGLEPLFEFVDDFSEFAVVEPRSDFVENARTLSDADHRISIIEGKLEDSYQQIQKREYDFIVISSLLHEVSHPEVLLQTVYKLCNKETMVYIDVPNKYSFHRLLGVAMGVIGCVDDKSDMDKRFHRCHHFSQESLTQLVVKQNFNIVRKWTFYIKPFSNSQMEEMVKCGIINSSVIKGLEKLVEYLPNHGSSISMELELA